MAFVDDGTGTGNKARVTSEKRLSTEAVASPIQHHISHNSEGAYQVSGEATLAAATVSILHIENTSTDNDMIVSYIRLQIVGQTGGTAIPNTSNYFRVSTGRTYASGGALKAPTNVHFGSPKTSEVSVYSSGATLAGTAIEIDRWYPTSDGDRITYTKEGSIIIPRGQTLEMSYIGDHTGGLAYARVSFFMQSRHV
jgi:hypothetical protein